MSEKNDGGPAFPQIPELGDIAYTTDGMTLRDYFAAKELGKVDVIGICDVPEAYDRIADHCYRMADAMLRARDA